MTLLPTVPDVTFEEITKKTSDDSTKEKKIYDHQLVRTDCKERKLEAFFTSSPTDLPSSSNEKTEANKDGNIEELPTRVEIQLTSILELRNEIEKDCHPGLNDVIQHMTFVGCVDQKFALFQHNTNLYLGNTHEISKELFYQIMLKDFGNFGALRLSNPAPIADLAMIALDSEDSGWTVADGPKESLAKYVVDLLKSKAPMLDEYFSVEIDEGAFKIFKTIANPAGCEKRCVIGFLNARNVKPVEIHRQLVQSFGENVMSEEMDLIIQ
ncbi:DNA mismatch repair protein Mlh1 [Trichonephila clavipes]|uniref:DNA mismatch repair protein Mlh1 n=1 Tax=Trichonephila clavipes TaxID=2585209 RepID=A0A8X6VXQ9_TRICX|nr:DNA mismatch repair protein Mlh1 [Trichonephila clavipes]